MFRKKKIVQARMSEKSGCCRSTIWSTTLWWPQERDEAWGRQMETITQWRWINQTVSSLKGNLLYLTGHILPGSVGAGGCTESYCLTVAGVKGLLVHHRSLRESNWRETWTWGDRETTGRLESLSGCRMQDMKCFNLQWTSEQIKEKK